MSNVQYSLEWLDIPLSQCTVSWVKFYKSLWLTPDGIDRVYICHCIYTVLLLTNSATSSVSSFHMLILAQDLDRSKGSQIFIRIIALISLFSIIAFLWLLMLNSVLSGCLLACTWGHHALITSSASPGRFVSLGSPSDFSISYDNVGPNFCQLGLVIWPLLLWGQIFLAITKPTL